MTVCIGSSASEEREDVIGIYRIVRTKTQHEISAIQRDKAERIANGEMDEDEEDLEDDEKIVYAVIDPQSSCANLQDPPKMVMFTAR